jgi:hypothetical protein
MVKRKRLLALQSLVPKFGALRVFFLLVLLISKLQGFNFLIFNTKLWNDERILSSLNSNFFKLSFEVWNSKRFFSLFMHEKHCKTQNMDFKRLSTFGLLKFGDLNYLLFGFKTLAESKMLSAMQSSAPNTGGLGKFQLLELP